MPQPRGESHPVDDRSNQRGLDRYDLSSQQTMISDRTGRQAIFHRLVRNMVNSVDSSKQEGTATYVEGRGTFLFCCLVSFTVSSATRGGCKRPLASSFVGQHSNEAVLVSASVRFPKAEPALFSFLARTMHSRVKVKNRSLLLISAFSRLPI